MRKTKPAALRLAAYAFASVTVAAAVLLGAGEARAEEKLGLLAPGPTTGPLLPAEGLPLPTGPGRPVRQFVFAICTGLPAGLCRYTSFLVPANKLLQIDSITCTATTTGVKHFVLTNSTDVDALLTSAKANIVPRFVEDKGGGNFDTFADSSGPFFFVPGERVNLFGGGNAGSGCGFFGHLFPTN
jgi:hypothetical protein